MSSKTKTSETYASVDPYLWISSVKIKGSDSIVHQLSIINDFK